MQLPAALSEKDTVEVTVSPLRSDIFHACDILEDVAISYGYTNILRVCAPPTTLCKGKQQQGNNNSDKLRRELALAGYTEVLTFSLCSTAENYAMLNFPDDRAAVTIANPKTQEFQIVRTSLYPGLLKTIKSNKDVALPLNIFEISDVVTKDKNSDVGATNKRCLAALHVATTADFEVIHGLCDRVFQMVDILHISEYKQWKVDEQKGQENKKQYSKAYYLKSHDYPMYLPGRCAAVVLHDARTSCDTILGHFGIIHPNVLKNYDIQHALIAGLHIDVAPLFQ